MTQPVDIVNRSLQAIGTRTTVTAGELAAQSSNEAIQANILLETTRDSLLRMAPWDCCTTAGNLSLITALPGTPENQSPTVAAWAPGLPIPPWAYEYQYPADCLRALYIVSQFQTGLGGVPITTAVTGFTVNRGGPPIKFKVGVDAFYPALSATVVSGGAGYLVNDIITLATGPITSAPIGGPAQLLVTSVAAGVITGVSVINSMPGADTPQSGAYFSQLSAAQAQGSTTGSGAGATFTLGYGPQGQQRVVLTNQESACLMYCRQVTDPNTMDQMFQDAWVNVLAAGLCMALTGDKQLANKLVADANKTIELARATDANEALTINDVTPDFLRIRGVIYSDWGDSNSGYDWGSCWSAY